ncbi:MAG: VOC family protein [Actinomycetota bacterium]|jgi:hypothetical protein|nr:VOC family protein [Actinomycetota bacterium]
MTEQWPVGSSAVFGSASHVVIGTTNIDATVRFFGAFDFGVEAADADSVTMGRGSGHPTELVLSEAKEGSRLTGYDLGPRGLDIYTTAMEESVERAVVAGGDPGPIATIDIGPFSMRQVTIWGPDHVPVVLIESPSRRASLLDDNADELHSQIHSLVWAVADRAAEAPWWEDRGATRGMDLAFGSSEVAAFMCLPDTTIELEMVMFANAANDPIRFELLRFVGHDGADFAGADLAGIQAVGFTVRDASPHRMVSPGGVVIDVRPAR